jgi:hypothetical protein
LEGVAKPGAICLSEDAYRQVKSRLGFAVTDLGNTQLKNIADPVRLYSLEVGQPAQAKPAPSTTPADQAKSRLGCAPPCGGRKRLVSPRWPQRETGPSRPSVSRRLAAQLCRGRKDLLRMVAAVKHDGSQPA